MFISSFHFIRMHFMLVMMMMGVHWHVGQHDLYKAVQELAQGSWVLQHEGRLLCLLPDQTGEGLQVRRVVLLLIRMNELTVNGAGASIQKKAHVPYLFQQLQHL